MGLFSRLFGRSNEPEWFREVSGNKAFQDVSKLIHRILEDEEFQLDFVHPTIKPLLESAPGYDKDPNGEGPFGFTETNPVPVNGPIGQLSYLSKLETQSGQRILFHRLGAINKVDVFEAVSFNGNEWFILFMDFYHSRRSRLVPQGFRFTKELGQFCGFNNFCEKFPYDFEEKKFAMGDSGLRIAYIPSNKVAKQIRDGVFNRPLAHEVKLELVKSRLSSFQNQ